MFPARPEGIAALYWPAAAQAACHISGDWCNGSTRHSGCRSWGSNPWSPVPLVDWTSPPPGGIGWLAMPGRTVSDLLTLGGGLLLFVSLFLSWYDPGVDAWTAFEVLDLVLAAAGAYGAVL